MGIGLYLLGDEINLGAQLNRGNEWTGTFSNLAALHTQDDDPQDSQFQINSDPNTCDEDYLPNSNGNPSLSPQATWFIPSTSGCLNPCAITVQEGAYLNNELNEVEYSIITGNGNTSSSCSAALWGAASYVYKKLMETGITDSTSDQQIIAFVGSLSNTNIGDFYEIEGLIQEANSSESFANDLLSSFAELSSVNEDFEFLLDAWLESTGDGVVKANLISNIDGLQGQQQDLGVLLSNFSTYRKSVLQNALILVDAISVNTIHELYLKTVFKTRICKLLDKELTQTEIDALKGIASECFKIGGIAVYLAPGLLDPEIQGPYLIPTYCGESFETPDLYNFTENYTDYQIFPNPVSNQIVIKTRLENGFTGVIKVYDVLGELKMKKQLKEVFEEQFDLSKLNPGIYYFHFESMALPTEVIRIVVK